MLHRAALNWICAAAMGLLLVRAVRAEDAAALMERLHAADGGSALDTADAKPWHLKMTVQLFDSKGKPSDAGTIEEWWSSPGVERRDYKTTGYTATEIRKDGKVYRTAAAGSPPYYLELLRTQAVHPMPEKTDAGTFTPDLRKTPFGKVMLDCIMLTQPIKPEPPSIQQAMVIPLGLFPTYCFDAGKSILRASFDFGGQLILRNAIATFAGKTVASDVTVTSENVVAAKSEIATLKMEEIPDDEFALNTDVNEQMTDIAKIASGVMAGHLVTHPDPIYPASAKERHISGTVLLHAVIGTDGHVHSLTITSTPDPDLAISAIAAVRKWTYKPYLLMGVPTDVETTITVHYEFGP